MSDRGGLKIGPLDPDATGEWSSFAAQANARELIRLHAQSYAPALTRALSLKRDDERTKGLDMDEVTEYVSGLQLENGDPVLPEGAVVTGAAVRGERGRSQTLCFSYDVPSGRSGKWFAPFDEDKLPTSAEQGAELAKVKEMRDRGIVAYDDQGAGRYMDQRELGRMRRENAALRKQLEARGDGETVDLSDLGPEGDTRPDNSIAEDNQDLRRQVYELVEANARLQAALEDQSQTRMREDAALAAERQQHVAGQDPPFEGYEDLKAQDVADRLKGDDSSEAERRAVLEYERSHANRKTVVQAAEESLGRTG